MNKRGGGTGAKTRGALALARIQGFGAGRVDLARKRTRTGMDRIAGGEEKVGEKLYKRKR